MAAAAAGRSAQDRRKEVTLLSDLPGDFLRLPGQSTSAGGAASAQIEADQAAALALQQQIAGAVQPFYLSSFMPPNTRGRLTARLTKNYGLVRMDPYCRMRVGTTVFETPTDANGSKTPKWNRTVHCYLPDGIENVFVEIFDERAFTMDERVAWAHVPIPSAVFNRETIDDWYALSGSQGDDKEGMINLVFAFAELTQSQRQQQQPAAAIPHQPAVPQGPLFTEKDVAEIGEIFPNVAADVITSILEEKRGNKEATINALLLISNDAE